MIFFSLLFLRWFRAHSIGVFFLSVLCSAVEQVPDNKPDQTASQSNHRPQADGQHLEGRWITLSRAGDHGLYEDRDNEGQQTQASHGQAYDLEGVQRFLTVAHTLASEARLSRVMYLAARPQ